MRIQKSSDQTKSRVLRLMLAPWLLIGHGIPKFCAWILGVPTWGPHIEYVPRNFSSGVSAFIELICPLLILIGLKVRFAAGLVALMLASSAFALPFPWLHVRVPITGYSTPFAIIPSKEMALAYAIAYMALAFYGQDESIWKKFRKK